MFVCKTCLERDYTWPKFDQTFSRSMGPCEICGNADVCVDQPARMFDLKTPVTSWECVAKQPGVGGECHCGPITPEHEVIEILRDAAGGVRCIVTKPNPKAAHAEYVRSFRCAGEVVKAHLRSKAKQPVPSLNKFARFEDVV